MNFVNLTGLWCLEESFALRMHGIINARILAGKSPLSTSFFSDHPAKSIEARLKASKQPVMAGSMAYYDYIASAYTVDGVCVISIVGTLTRYGMCNWGYEDLAGILAAADRSEAVRAILLKIDSGGGSVDGLRAFADAVRATKKVVMVWTSFCASAAYFIASQATEIWLEDSPLQVIGSIGTLMVYTDQSQALEKEGYQVEIFRATESVDKARINGIEPLSNDDRQEIQEMLDGCQKEFAGYVRRGRAGLLTSDEWKSAKMYGPSKGIALGLADQKGTLQGAIKRALQLSN
ncbi:S49 family peptidase [Spirosoma sp. 48-14]|uniref:S49 family peptidase n=1 Tax=Spirosoma sp. 48-14 TaxID=1895854 RepID=UPI00095ED520|nr:S49 family peptidase [Spirosoma sp. 48-14]OJW76342.1 MAG: hypothetical protein BGO59_22750 [Spirosoma sp. 48-14]